jgi:hypothetical protein
MPTEEKDTMSEKTDKPEHNLVARARIQRATVALDAFEWTGSSKGGLLHLVEAQSELMAALSSINERLEEELTK